MPSDRVQRNDLENEYLDSWDRYKVVSENSIHFYFSAGTSSFYGQRTVVQESDDSIHIGIIEGKIPGAPPACIIRATNTSFLLQTKNPIAGRSIIRLRNTEGLKLNRKNSFHKPK